MEVGWAGSAPHFIYMHHTSLKAPAHLWFLFCCLLFCLHVLISMVFADMGSVLTKLLRATNGAAGWIHAVLRALDSQLTAVYAESPDEDVNVMTLETLAAHRNLAVERDIWAKVPHWKLSRQLARCMVSFRRIICVLNVMQLSKYVSKLALCACTSAACIVYAESQGESIITHGLCFFRACQLNAHPKRTWWFCTVSRARRSVAHSRVRCESGREA